MVGSHLWLPGLRRISTGHPGAQGPLGGSGVSLLSGCLAGGERAGLSGSPSVKQHERGQREAILITLSNSLELRDLAIAFGEVKQWGADPGLWDPVNIHQ